MTTEQENNVLGGIQAALEELKGIDDDILFLESRHNRGVLMGSIENLTLLFAYNMAAYPQFKLIVELARKLYTEKKEILENYVKEDKPTHEIIDTFGYNVEKMIERLEQGGLDG